MHPKEEAVLKLMEQDVAYENYFFKQVTKLKWFYPLKEKGYFSPEKNIGPQPADKEGYLVIPQWNVLDYLERISSQLSNPDNEGYINELLEIIRSVTNYKDSDGKVIDNYRTWWYFVKILINIPTNKIPVEIIKLIPIWLSSRFGSSLVDADISKKLLPKFFNKNASPEDLVKGELIIDYLTDIRWVEKKGIFKKIEESPEGIVDDYWLKEALFDRGIAELIGEIGSEEVIYTIADKLKLIFRRYSKTNWIDFNQGDRTYRFSINQSDDFNYDCSIGFYKKEKNEEEALLKSLSVEEITTFSEFTINAQDSSEFAEKVEEKIKEIDVSEEFKKELNNKSKNLYKNVLEDFSYIWLKDLSSVADLYHIQHILLMVLAIALVKKAEINITSTREILETFLSTKYQNPAFTRLVLITISKNWDALKDIFWDKLFPREKDPIFEMPDLEHELRLLFRDNVSKFTEEEKNKITKVLDSGPQIYLPEKNPEGYVIYWKQRWYGALKEEATFNKNYLAVKALANFDDTLEDKDTGGSWIGIPDSELSSEQMIKISNTELAAFLVDFNKKDKLEKRNSEAVAKALEVAVKRNPEKFENLEPFINTGFYYVYHILNGFKEAWNSKNSFNWNLVVAFIEKYINRPIFWKNELIVPSGFYKADNRWIMSAIGELIQSGTVNDEWSIPESSFPLIMEIFYLIATKAAKDENNSEQFPTHVINCGLGKTVIGLVYFILRIARLEKKGDEPRWNNNVKQIFEAFLNRNIYDAYTVLGENLITFRYLDKEWAENQINKVDESQDKVLWDAFMSGYLAASRVNLELYKLMKNFYIKGLSYDFKERQLNDRLIDHIGIGYLNGVEDINGNGLLNILWESQSTKQMQAFIFYLWTQRNNLKDNDQDVKMKSRIIDFWKKIYLKYKDKKTLTKDDKELLSDVIKLINYLPELNEENTKWLLLSSRYAEERYNSPYLLEFLNLLKDKGEKVSTANQLGQILLTLVKSSKPEYDVTDIQAIVEHLYRVDNPEVKKLANQICEEYAKSSIEIVTDIYKRYNS